MVVTFLVDLVAAYQDGWTASDWFEVIFADADLASDILFAIEVKQKTDECMSVQDNDCATLYQIYVSSVSFIVVPLVAGILWNVWFLLGDELYSRRLKDFYTNIDRRLSWMKTPPLFLIYVLCHLCNFIVLSSSLERLAKIAISRAYARRRLLLNSIGFVLESVPQLSCQIVFLQMSGPTPFAILSMSITCYKLVSSFSFKIYLSIFRDVAVLCDAAGRGDAEAVNQLLSAKCDVNAKYEGRAPVHFAAEQGNVAALTALVEAGAKVDETEEGGRTPLHWAAEKGKREALAALVAAKADVGVKDAGGRTPLHWAAEKGKREALAALVAAKADVGAKDEVGRTPLHSAAQSGYAEAVTALVAEGADVRATDNEGWTPLYLATKSSREEAMAALVAADRNPHARQPSNGNRTPGAIGRSAARREPPDCV